MGGFNLTEQEAAEKIDRIINDLRKEVAERSPGFKATGKVDDTLARLGILDSYKLYSAGDVDRVKQIDIQFIIQLIKDPLYGPVHSAAINEIIDTLECLRCK